MTVFARRWIVNFDSSGLNRGTALRHNSTANPSELQGTDAAVSDRRSGAFALLEAMPLRSEDEGNDLCDSFGEFRQAARTSGRGTVLSGVSEPSAGPQADAGTRRTRLDPDALAKLAELDPTGRTRLVERVLVTFLGSVARLRLQFERGWLERDLPTVRLVVHTLKSSSASVGAMRLAEVCGAIENAIRLEHHADLAPLVATAAGAFDDAVSAIEAVLEDRSS